MHLHLHPLSSSVSRVSISAFSSQDECSNGIENRPWNIRCFHNPLYHYGLVWKSLTSSSSLIKAPSAAVHEAPSSPVGEATVHVAPSDAVHESEASSSTWECLDSVGM
ncbi:hypothetical protein Hanom_Chr09g00790891 [Helianthus anomalus]